MSSYVPHDPTTVDLVQRALARLMAPGGDLSAEQRLATLGEVGRLVSAALGVAWNGLASEPADGEDDREREALVTIGPRLASLLVTSVCSRAALTAAAEAIRTESLEPLREWLADDDSARGAVMDTAERLRRLMAAPAPSDRHARLYIASGGIAAQLAAWAASALYADRLYGLMRNGVHPVEASNSPDSLVPWARSSTVYVDESGGETVRDTGEQRRAAEVEDLLRELFRDSDGGAEEEGGRA